MEEIPQSTVSRIYDERHREWNSVPVKSKHRQERGKMSSMSKGVVGGGRDRNILPHTHKIEDENKTPRPEGYYPEISEI